MEISKKGGLGGLIFDMFTGVFPVGTLIGGLAKNFMKFDANDMDKAHDPKAQASAATSSFGDLKGMASGLFGSLETMFSGPKQSANETNTRDGRPRTDDEAPRDAQTKSGVGGGWGKALVLGGVVLAGLTMAADAMFFGFAGMPFYGAGFMMPGLFW